MEHEIVKDPKEPLIYVGLNEKGVVDILKNLGIQVDWLSDMGKGNQYLQLSDCGVGFYREEGETCKSPKKFIKKVLKCYGLKHKWLEVKDKVKALKESNNVK